MKRRDLAWLAVLQAVVLLAVGVFQHSPGYMDADYYTIMGKQLAAGSTAEPFLWNYLDDPQGLPHAGFAYWQPLAAMLAAVGVALLRGVEAFAAARLPFFLLAVGIPPLTALLAYALGGRRLWAWMAGVLAVFSGFYLPYLAVPDTFTPLMVLGALFFLVALWEGGDEGEKGCGWLFGGVKAATCRGVVWPLGLGVLAGLFSLARAEGFLWLLAAWGVLFLAKQRRLQPYGWALGGYLAVAAPWMLRNWHAFGALSAPGGLRALWLTEYNDVFLYPASQLTFARWWATGWEAILRARGHAALTNALSAVAVQGQIVWLPFALVGAWQQRRKPAVAAGVGMWGLLWLLMSVVFPFAGERGGFFHAGAAVQPLVWALAPLGLAAALRPLARWRRWDFPQAERVLGWGLVAAAVLLSLLAVQRRVIGSDWRKTAWDKEWRAFVRLEAGLEARGVPKDAVILVNNPPGFTLFTGRPSLVVPSGSRTSAGEVARRYGARYWILEPDHPKPFNHAYCHPTTVPPPWRYAGEIARDVPFFVLESAP